MPRRLIRTLAVLMIALGVFGAAWVFVVWQWKDPFTTLYTVWEQHQLSGQYDKRVKAWHADRFRHAVSRPGVLEEVAAEARRYRRSSVQGQAIGRIEVPRLGLDMVVVNGTNEASLEKGPGRDLRSFMPGEGRLVYIAGHRTTYAAPFANIDSLRPGDAVTLELPYATFRYSITGHRIVAADDVSVLRSRGREQLELQACHPRFFATHRYIAYARPVSVRLRSGRAFRYGSRRVSRQA
jgi:sortase A